MRRAVVPAFFAVLLQAAGAPAVLNPHNESTPNRCLSCHDREMAPADPGADDSFLLRDSIDGLCLICHLKQDCCTIGQRHADRPGDIGVSHPSDIDARSVSRASRPKTLPLQDGRITCYTCHLHDRQKPADYKLVRMVLVKPTGVDWTALCHDCHAEY